MNPEGRYLLNPAAIISHRQGAGDAMHMLVKPGSRTGGQGVDDLLHSLLLLFRTPTPILDAIIQHANENGRDPEGVLEEAWGGLSRLIEHGFLVEEESNHPLRPCLTIGDHLGAVRIVECVRLMDDFQVYRGVQHDGTRVAVKVGFPATPRTRMLLGRERDILRLLPTDVAPVLFEYIEEPVLALISEWCEGEPLARWARGPRTDRLVVASRVARLYARMHASGVLHVDINPGNVIVGRDGVRAVDFAGSLRIGEDGPIPRMGVLAYQEPEFVAAVASTVAPPAPSSTGEQYGVAALIFNILMGVPPVALAEDRATAWSQVINGSPRPFSSFGAFDLDDVEAVLRRALSKERAARFGSVAEFAEALDDALAAAQVRARARGRSGAREALLLALSPGGRWFGDRLPASPRCSVNGGATGVSLAMLELSLRRDDDSLLRSSGYWLSRAKLWRERPDAFRDADAAVLEDVVSDGISILHTESGVLWMEALLHDAFADEPERERAILELSRRSGGLVRSWDLTLGMCSYLSGVSALVRRTGSKAALELGSSIYNQVLRHFAGFGPIGREDGSGLNLGMAHGWAGVLWCVARWCQATGQGLPGEAYTRADQLLAAATRTGPRSLIWPWRTPTRDIFAPSWCNGAAGMVMAYSELACAPGGNPTWADVAAQAAAPLLGVRWGAGHLCCGAAGGAYALARIYRMDGDPVWLRAAVSCRDTALALVGRSESPAGLYKGDLGAMLVDVEAQDFTKLDFPGA